MKIKKLTGLLLALIIILNTLAGCGGQQSFLLYFALGDRPQTLDPQLAQTAGSKTVVTALFEGLTRFNEKGEPVLAAAKSYTVSQDQKTYRFTLREGLEWSNGEALTAQDFVFGLTRALAPKTNAPEAEKLLCIQNAAAYRAGQKVMPAVTALSKTEVEITLAYPNDDLLQTLTLPVALPCNEAYFNKCGGKYGLDADHLLTNGPFTLYSWANNSHEDFAMRLNRSKTYNGSFKAAAGGVIFSYNGELKGNAKRVALGNIDFAYALAEEVTAEMQTIEPENTSCLLVINRESNVGSAKMCKALAQSIHRNRLQNELSTQMNVTDRLLPSTLKIGTVLAKNITEPAAAAYDPESALQLYKACAKVQEPGDTAILYAGESDGKLAALVAEGFQQSLSFFVNTKQCTSTDELLQKIADKDFKLAILPLTAGSNDAADYLLQLSRYNLTKAKFAAPLQQATGKSQAARVAAAEQALKTIAAAGTVLPLAHRYDVLAYSQSYTCPNFSAYAAVPDLALVSLKNN